MDSVIQFLEEHTFIDNSLWAWTRCLICILVALALRFIIDKLINSVVRRIVSKTDTQFDDLILDNIVTPVMCIIVLLGFRVGFSHLSFSEGADRTIGYAFAGASTLLFTWLISRVVKCALDFFFQKYKDGYGRNRSSAELQVVSMINKVFSTIIWVFGIVTAINNVGYDVGTLIAGLGIGSLAMALAAQNTVSNIFGGVTIIFDRPFTIGDRVRLGGYDGYVEHIGMRTVHLRTLSGTLVSIPNSTITDSMVENVTREPSRKVTITLGLVYETTHEQMQQAMDILRQIVADRQDILMPNSHITFDEFADFSLNINFIFFIRKGKDTFTSKSDVNMEILKRFGEAGLSFAFPSHTLYFDPATYNKKS